MKRIALCFLIAALIWPAVEPGAKVIWPDSLAQHDTSNYCVAMVRTRQTYAAGDSVIIKADTIMVRRFRIEVVGDSVRIICKDFGDVSWFFRLAFNDSLLSAQRFIRKVDTVGVPAGEGRK